MKRIFKFPLTLFYVINIILPVLLLNSCEAVFEETIDIPDENFMEALIREGVTRNRILTVDEAEAVTSLFLRPVHSMDGFDESTAIKTVKGIEYFSNLEKLECYRNEITNLDLSDNTSLRELICMDNFQLKNLDVTNCTALRRLHCITNRIVNLHASGCTSLTDLECGYNPIENLDVSNCISLRNLNCFGNQLTNLELQGCDLLTHIHCPYGHLTSLDISTNTELIELICYENQLSSLDVSENTALTKMDCSRNMLTSLDVSNNTVLTYLGCGDNQLTSLDISRNAKLENIYLGGSPDLTQVCVWTMPFPPDGVTVSAQDSPNIYFTTDCSN